MSRLSNVCMRTLTLRGFVSGFCMDKFMPQTARQLGNDYNLPKADYAQATVSVQVGIDVKWYQKMTVRIEMDDELLS